MNRLQKIIIIFALATTLLPLFSQGVWAQGSINYAPISPVPGSIDPGTLSTGGVEGYLNAVFKLSIGIGALLAVVQITIGGIKYMTSGVASTIESARAQIREALLGLLLLLSTWIILNEINPDLVNFRIGPSSMNLTPPVVYEHQHLDLIS